MAGETARGLADIFDVTLVYCFEKAGVLRDENDDDSVIPAIDPGLFEKLKADGIVTGGMLPKIENALKAVADGVKEVVITQASSLDDLRKGTHIRL